MNNYINIYTWFCVCECIYLFTMRLVLSNTHVGILQLESTLCSSQKVGCQRHHRVCLAAWNHPISSNCFGPWVVYYRIASQDDKTCGGFERDQPAGGNQALHALAREEWLELGKRKRWLKGGLSHFLFCFFPISVPSRGFRPENQQGRTPGIGSTNKYFTTIPGDGAVWKCRTHIKTPWISILRSCSNLGWFGSTQYGYPYDLGNLHIIYIYYIYYNIVCIYINSIYMWFFMWKHQNPILHLYRART